MMADHRLSKDVIMACLRGAEAVGALLSASKRRKWVASVLHRPPPTSTQDRQTAPAGRNQFRIGPFLGAPGYV